MGCHDMSIKLVKVNNWLLRACYQHIEINKLEILQLRLVNLANEYFVELLSTLQDGTFEPVDYPHVVVAYNGANQEAYNWCIFNLVYICIPFIHYSSAFLKLGDLLFRLRGEVRHHGALIHSEVWYYVSVQQLLVFPIWIKVSYIYCFKGWACLNLVWLYFSTKDSHCIFCLTFHSVLNCRQWNDIIVRHIDFGNPQIGL